MSADRGSTIAEIQASPSPPPPPLLPPPPLIHVLYGSPPEFQSFVFKVDDLYEGPGVLENEVQSDADQPSQVSASRHELPTVPSKITSRYSTRTKGSFRMADIPQEEPNPNNALIPLAELNKTHFMLNTGVVAVNFRQHLRKKIFEPLSNSSRDERWELLVPILRRWILDNGDPEQELDEHLLQEIERTLLSGYSTTRGSEVNSKGWTPRGTLIPSIRAVVAEGIPGSIGTVENSSLDDDNDTSVLLPSIDRRTGQFEILFGYFGKFLFDAEEALERLTSKVDDLDLCDRRGAISGISLLPDYDGCVGDFGIFASRELHYPILLSKADAHAVAFPESTRISTSSSDRALVAASLAIGSVAEPRLVSSSSPTQVQSKRAASNKAPQRRGASKGTEAQRKQSQPPSPQQRQQSETNVYPSYVSVRFAASAAAAVMEDASIKEFVHPLLLKLFRPDLDAVMAAAPALGGGAEGTGWNASALKIAISQQLAPLKQSPSAKALEVPSSAVRSGGRTLSPSSNVLPSRNFNSTTLKKMDSKSKSERAAMKITEEKMVQMASVLDERELSDEDIEVLKSARLTTGVRVLLYLRDQFTDSSLLEFLESLRTSCLELRMFEEEQMIFKMPIFQLPPELQADDMGGNDERIESSRSAESERIGKS